MSLFKIISVCKGGRYKYCRTEPPHPRANANGLYPLHRVIAENKIGRLLEAYEVVHHIDENKFNNTPENLEVLSRHDHSFQHQSARMRQIEASCSWCETKFALIPSRYRKRKANLYGLFCSRECAGHAQGDRPRVLSHGASGYVRGCRCEECRAGQREKMRAYRASKCRVGFSENDL